MFIRRRCRLTLLIFFSMLPFLTSPGALAQNGWVGEYSSPHGVSLSLHDEGSGRLAGTLTVDENPLPVQLQMHGSALEGTFESSGTTFPVSITTGEEPDQIVIASEGSMFELAWKPGSANPLAARANRPANPLTRPQSAEGRPAVDLSGNFNDPNGYFSMNVPPDWRANMMADDVFELTTAQVQQYQQQSQSLYYGQGGGYDGQQGGGSVYSHFPNMGASGSSVGVADLGGGDTIVNAGGVMWWPGK